MYSSKSTLAMAFLLLSALLATAYSAQAWTTSTVYSFTGGADGMGPRSSLVTDEQGNAYGTTVNGGAFSYGTVFELTPAGTETVLYSFSGGADGANPFAGVVLDGKGNIYGTTPYGGAFGYGTVFRLEPTGVETVLHSFAGTPGDGAFVYSGVVLGKDGNIYGTTGRGGAGNGTVFKLSPFGTETILHSFNYRDGDVPGEVILDEEGNLFGTTAYGGAYGYGTVFSIAPDGTQTILREFRGGADGAIPAGRLLFANGGLYGTASYGGASNNGVVFSITPSGLFTVRYSFAGAPDGANPVGTLALGRGGCLYGVTFRGGVGGSGTVFKLTRSGKESVLHRFKTRKRRIDGIAPYGGLVRDPQGSLLGTTGLGGPFDAGTVFKVAVTP